jgi:hypothetical protein
MTAKFSNRYRLQAFDGGSYAEDIKMLVAIAGAALALQVGLSQLPPAGTSIQQVQFLGRDNGCPRGYDFNFSNGRCYPNAHKAPGVYKRPIPDDPPPYGYYRPHGYGYPRYAPGYYGR